MGHWGRGEAWRIASIFRDTTFVSSIKIKECLNPALMNCHSIRQTCGARQPSHRANAPHPTAHRTHRTRTPSGESTWLVQYQRHQCDSPPTTVWKRGAASSRPGSDFPRAGEEISLNTPLQIRGPDRGCPTDYSNGMPARPGGSRTFPRPRLVTSQAYTLRI